MAIGSKLFKRYRKLMVISVILMFLLSTIPTASACRQRWKPKCKPKDNFDLNGTIEKIDETFKIYCALAQKIENLEEELDELIKLTKKCKISVLDMDPYENKRDDLKSELDALPQGRVRPPFDQPYGMREFHVKDPDGCLLFFGQEIDS